MKTIHNLANGNGLKALELCQKYDNLKTLILRRLKGLAT